MPSSRRCNGFTPPHYPLNNSDIYKIFTIVISEDRRSTWMKRLYFRRSVADRRSRPGPGHHYRVPKL